MYEDCTRQARGGSGYKPAWAAA